MHALSFRLKRAHLRAMEIHKPLARMFGLTPARFDVMSVIRMMGGACWQSTIAAYLGVSGVTIGRMVQALEEQGLVRRDEDPYDRRKLVVRLTRCGFECIVGAIKAFLRGDQLRRVYDEMHPDGHGFVEMAEKMARHIGRALFDTSHLDYALDPPTAAAIADGDDFNQQVLMFVERLEAHHQARKKPKQDDYDPIPPSDEDLGDSCDWDECEHDH
jgi:DNA-binding MarR family transcriptional regulator